MNLSAEQIDMVEELAELFFSPEDIAVNLELNDEETEIFVDGVTTRCSSIPVVGAYIRGWLQGEITLRKAIMKAAINGSNPSQQQLLNFLKESKR